MRPDGPRDKIIGPDSGPQSPFPLRMKGKVVSGFGRGSKELGIPTANLPVDSAPWIDAADSGVYFGWAGIQLPADHPSHPHSTHTPTTSDSAPAAEPLSVPSSIIPAAASASGWRLFPFVMSIGYNPFYKNTVRSAEVHILHQFPQDFYGSEMAISILGFIRPEYDYVSVESLVEDINEDIAVTKRSLDREAWRKSLNDPYLWGEEAEQKT